MMSRDAIQSVVTSVQDRLTRMGLFKDKVDGLAGMSTWMAVEAALRELQEHRKTLCTSPK